jgi:TctA family transporter
VNFRQAMIVSEGNLLVFFQRPICAVLLLVALVIIITAALKKRTFTQPLPARSSQT